jgi:hypothetical protein
VYPEPDSALIARYRIRRHKAAELKPILRPAGRGQRASSPVRNAIFDGS